MGYVKAEEYATLVRDAERFLGGKSTHIQAELAQDMQTASDNMEFERAGALRDRIKAMTRADLARDQPARRS